jgi:hypothetical protein
MHQRDRKDTKNSGRKVCVLKIFVISLRPPVTNTLQVALSNTKQTT